MSVSKWAYTPEMCDGDICVGDCDLCDKPKITQIHNTATTQVQTDYIKREGAINIALAYIPDDDGSCSKADADQRDMLDELENIPSADVVEVVRCKDCKYYHKKWNGSETHYYEDYWCEWVEPDENYFCSLGEVKHD